MMRRMTTYPGRMHNSLAGQVPCHTGRYYLWLQGVVQQNFTVVSGWYSPELAIRGCSGFAADDACATLLLGIRLDDQPFVGDRHIAESCHGFVPDFGFTEVRLGWNNYQSAPPGFTAWVDDFARLYVGPQSAGADPGPAAYGKGGTEPTVTDADVVLGFIDPDYFLAGRIRLDRQAFRPQNRQRVDVRQHVRETSIRMATNWLLTTSSMRCMDLQNSKKRKMCVSLSSS
jgi:hypothetical protein